MTPTTRTRLIRYLGYPLFFLVAFAAMFYLTFPYRQVVGLVAGELRRSGYVVSVGKVGPGLAGVTARRILLLPEKALDPAMQAIVAATPGEAPPLPPETIAKGFLVDELVARPSLFPVGITFQATLFGGKARGSLGLAGARKSVVFRLRGLDLAKGRIKDVVGLDLEGRLDSTVDLRLDPADFSKATGRLVLASDGLLINGGSVGEYDLPRIDLGRLEGEVKIDDAKATVQSFKSTGADLEAMIEGEVELAAKPEFSALKLKVQLKPSDDWLKRNAMLQAGLGFAMTRDGNGFYVGQLGGMLGKPRFSKNR